MNASIRGALAQFDTAWNAFTHKGKPMTKKEVKAVLEYASAVGYETTGELDDDEVDKVIDGSTREVELVTVLVSSLTLANAILTQISDADPEIKSCVVMEGVIKLVGHEGQKEVFCETDISKGFLILKGSHINWSRLGKILQNIPEQPIKLVFSSVSLYLLGKVYIA